LEKEGELREHREKALNFLENISRNLQSDNEQVYIEKYCKFLRMKIYYKIGKFEKLFNSRQRT